MGGTTKAVERLLLSWAILYYCQSIENSTAQSMKSLDFYFLRCSTVFGHLRYFFAGSIPKELGKLNNLEKLYLFNNQLTGESCQKIMRAGIYVD